jgi:hypothetical protein
MFSLKIPTSSFLYFVENVFCVLYDSKTATMFPENCTAVGKTSKEIQDAWANLSTQNDTTTCSLERVAS